MSISQALLSEFEYEAGVTRRFLERVPVDKFGWKPHEKSMALGHLATHLAEIPGWFKPTLELDELDLAGFQPVLLTSVTEVLEKFDGNVAAAKAAIGAAPDSGYMKPWTLKMGDQVFFTMPKAAVVRSFCMNHIVHHRAQLGVYLRLLDVAVPSTYGPSADEGKM